MKYPFLFAIFIFCVAPGKAQPPKQGAAKNGQAVKNVHPKVVTSLGKYSDSAMISVAEALELMALPLKIADDKKSVYPVVNYQFLYRRLGVTEDEQTGKTSPATTMVADVFSSTPLPAIWQSNITSQLKPGEELYFFDVVTKDAQGQLFFAPNLKFNIK